MITSFYIPKTTILFIVILIIIQINRNSLKKNYCNMNDEVDLLNIRVKKYFTTHLIHAGSFWGHFIPNILLTLIIGTLLETMVGSLRMLIYILCSIFIYWPIMYLFIKSYREGCGFSSIYFSFVSIYFSLIALYEKSVFLQIILIFTPYLFLFILNFSGHYIGKISTSSEGIHILSIIYGYIVGLIEYMII